VSYIWLCNSCYNGVFMPQGYIELGGNTWDYLQVAATNASDCRLCGPSTWDILLRDEDYEPPPPPPPGELDRWWMVKNPWKSQSVANQLWLLYGDTRSQPWTEP